MDQQHPTDTVQVTEAEAALYDRQIRLWGLEAQNRMRSSTILVVNLRSLAQETIKNIVLAGVGRLIVMDSEVVTEEDLGAGFLFRENDGVLGQKRVQAALPQIQKLNPLVTITPLETLSPFISTSASSDKEMDAFLEREKVDIVCVTDCSKNEFIRINESCRRTNRIFYASGGYGFCGYIFSDLGKEFEYVSPARGQPPPGKSPKMVKHIVNSPSFKDSVGSPDSANQPYKSIKNRKDLRGMNPSGFATLLSLWEYQSLHSGYLPNSLDAVEEILSAADKNKNTWEISSKIVPEIPRDVIEHLALHSTHEFSPTSAVLGGILAQDILKAISRNQPPIMNFLWFDGTSGGDAAVIRWGVSDEEKKH